MDSMKYLEDLGRMFYIASPNRTSFETTEEVPNYNFEAFPFFILFLYVEQIYMKLKKRRTVRINDMVTSVNQGLLQEVSGILLYGWRLFLYTYIYDNWRIVTLPWNSLWTWFICFIVVDFLYYWVHRACHEINFLWAAHQVHHSSEDYNLAVALRQSVTLNSLQWVFYLPMALAIPPSSYLVHNYFNLLYQYWIHTEAIKTIGPLEYILNTASHHRVHHGRNKYCIDKNYAGVLIIWDRIFGTFQAENETVVYGLTHNVNSFDTFYLQFCHFNHMWKTFREMKGWKNKISVFIKGPGWSPGKSWHGNPEDIPEIEYPVKKYGPQLSLGRRVYASWHGIIILIITYNLMKLHKELTTFFIYALSAFLMGSMTVMGHLFDNRSSFIRLEVLRCTYYFVLENYFLPLSGIEVFSPLLLTILRITFTASALFWMTYALKNVKVTWISLPKKID